MNKLSFYFIALLFIVSCKKEELKNESFTTFDCLTENGNKSQTKAEIQKDIYTTWKLKRLATMLPTDEIPNMKIQFKDVLGAPIDKQLVDVYIDDKLIGSVIYNLEEKSSEGFTYVLINSDNAPINGEYNFIRGSITICDDELRIDNGMASDGPGYFFKKD